MRRPKKIKVIPLSEKASHRGCVNKILEVKAQEPDITNSELARRADCAPSNVTQVLRRFLNGNTEAELRDYQANKADILSAFELNALGSITPEKLAKASVPALATTFGIIFDKRALTLGQPTAINLNVLADLAEELRARRG